MKYTAAVALFSSLAAAKNCKDLTIPIEAHARNGVFDIPIPSNDIDVTNFILDLTQQGANYTMASLSGYATVGGKYDIAATYCEPDSGPAGTLQVLTHGIGFDRTYWDLTIDNGNYSYVNDAVDEYGYSTFAWDRLGIGESSHGNPLSEIQALLEVDALRFLTEALRDGDIDGISTAYDTVVHVGHSFGSTHTYALTAMYPDISDGIALTGFSQNGSFVGLFNVAANWIEAKEYKALSDYVDGYFAPASQEGVQINFFAPGDFDPAVLKFAYMNGQPVTMGELLTIGGEIGSPNMFAGPVHIVTGERDIPFCGGNCLAAPTGYDSIPATSKQFFTEAEDFTVTIIPGAGHGLNLQYSHTTTFASVLDYFVQHGLGPDGSDSGSHGGSHGHPHGGPHDHPHGPPHGPPHHGPPHHGPPHHGPPA